MERILLEDTRAIQKDARHSHGAFMDFSAALDQHLGASQGTASREELLEQIVRGHVPPALETVSGAQETAARFADYTPTDRLVKKIASSSADRLEETFYDLEAERSLRRQLTEMPLPPFDELLAREAGAMELQLRSLNKMMHGAGDTKFDALRLYKEHGLAHSRVMSNTPVIMPKFFEKDGVDGGINPDKFPRPRPWQIAGFLDSKIGDYDYGFGFIKLETAAAKAFSPEDDQLRSIYAPAICLDRDVFHLLQDMQEKGGDKAGIADGVLHGIQDFGTIGNHDYVHHMIFGSWDKSAWDQAVQERLQAANGGPAARSRAKDLQSGNFTRRFTPMQDGPVPSELVSGVTGKRPPHEGLILPPLEKFSYLLNRDTWQQIFKEEPAVKEEMVHAAIDFMDNLKQFKEHVAEVRSPEAAGGMSAYLATIAMSRLYMIIGMEDPALEKPMDMGNGTTRSFKQAVEELGLPAYTPAKAWLDEVYKEHQNIPDFIIWEKLKNPKHDKGRLLLPRGDPNAPKPSDLSDTYAYALQRVGEWQKEKGKPLGEFQLEGYDALKAQVIMEGARAASWLNSYRVQDDPQMSTTQIASTFCENFFGDSIQKKPALRTAIAHFDEQATSLPPDVKEDQRESLLKRCIKRERDKKEAKPTGLAC